MPSLISYIDSNNYRDEIEVGLQKIENALSKHSISVRGQFWLLAGTWNIMYKVSKSNLGLCNHTEKTIYLNEQFRVGNHKAEEKSTFLHELAHMITRFVNKSLAFRLLPTDDKPHGKLWKFIAKSLGDDGERCANYDFFNNHVKAIREEKGHKHEYRCKDCGHVFKTQRVLARITHRFHGSCQHKTYGGRLIHTQVR